MTLFFGTCLATLDYGFSGSGAIDSQNRVHHLIRHVPKCIFFALGSKTNFQKSRNEDPRRGKAYLYTPPQKSGRVGAKHSILL